MILTELMKGITTQYTTCATSFSSLSTVSFYLDHAPQAVNYPIITYKVISSPRTWAMSSTTPHKYSNVRVQFSIFGNENQLEQCMNISNDLESIYDLNQISLGNNVANICTKINDESVSFYNENEKVWTIVQDIRFMVGI